MKPPVKPKRKTFAVRLDPELHKQAKAMGLSLSELFESVLRKAIGMKRLAE